ncbi:late embryogenesis abundant protein Lea14-A-like [Impatiens glandulifera]|uniref:late embryogenesis abundant protein Lea14-A-like n=1 Tax=Impatiens glandulifera TaxID=253017 RepID=UPI001FB0AC18|nr:late embryogenesis abundant protein Lea14-A-like [Impatiens glandulifera]
MDLLDKAKTFVAEKVAEIETPTADVTDVDMKDFSREGITYNAKVSVNNPYSHSIPICQISYTLKCAERDIVSGTIPDPGSLVGNEKTMVEVPVKVPHNVLLNLMKDIGADWDIDYQLDIGLTMNIPVVGNYTIPLSTKGEIKLPSFWDLWKTSGSGET